MGSCGSEASGEREGERDREREREGKMNVETADRALIGTFNVECTMWRAGLSLGR